MKIYLIGYMGCGKSTIGKRLAKELRWEYIDIDHYIEQIYQRTIADIFAKEGESYFRKVERQALETTFEQDNLIVATGGGAACFFDNMEQMNRNGICVYLQLSPENLIKRLINAQAERPLIKSKTPQELADFIPMMLEKRNPFYLKANYIVDNNYLTVEQAVLEVKNIILKHHGR